MKLQKILFTFFIIISIGTLAQYQNCADAKLSSVYKLSSVANISGKFCATNFNNPTKYAVKSFFVTNINAKVLGDEIKSDSDADGLTDDFENTSTNPTYNATNRRTFGILDSICATAGGANCNYNGTTAAMSTGLLESDLLGYSSSGSGLGFDADYDGIPDFLEILKSTDVIRDDTLNDNDLDQVNNLKEVQQATDPNSSEDQSLPPQFKTQVRYWISDLTGGGICPSGQKLYEFSVDSLPLVPTLAFNAENSEESYLSHAMGENLILISYTSEPESNTAQREYYTLIIKMNIRDASRLKFNTTASQFNLQGQY